MSKELIKTNETSATTEVSNFLRQIIDHDCLSQTYSNRVDSNGKLLPSVITRFPPEPNGYLHIGHAKSIFLNFGLARDYAHAINGARCHMRFDDTNPAKEETEYVNTILESVQWLGFNWTYGDQTCLYYASDYFDQLYQFAELLIQKDKAYIDSQSADEIHKSRGNFVDLGVNSPYRNRSIDENLALFRAMKDGQFQDGEHVLRLKIDMKHPNLVMRDPVIYRIRHAHHHRTGDKWCIYPLYDFTHCISDAIERVSHSICTLEFENNRPLYDWILNALCDASVLSAPLPHQYEFARLNLTYAITSKRKLLQLVQDHHVEGWNDPRMPTLVGLRRRGYTAKSLQLFCDRIGVSKADSWIEMSVLEQSLRDDLDPSAHRSVAVMKPLKLIIDNFDQAPELCSAPIHPHLEELGRRQFHLSKELWIESDDFMQEPVKGFFRLYPPINGQPGSRVRLRYGFVIECTGFDLDDHGQVTAVHANYFADSKSGTEGANTYKVKGNIHWLSAEEAIEAEVRVYDRLFTDPNPTGGDKDFLNFLNPHSKSVIKAYIDPSLALAKPEQSFQFERHGYFVADQFDHSVNTPVFNLSVGLKDTWKK
ncbi:glutamine--tRNA ligase/YqeY domain fusion protein [Polynucleobacter rarus]|uniref:glutamine--tRNA ligase/YqeY domain fusion protein n=1 Tax=Polynucleobacter rarus TaxID=556055 RepID=UPI000D3E1D2B|nr:glutamine--tRNA ligase/YqeY domain fusion protein [Polynucleobacter rarus]